MLRYVSVCIHTTSPDNGLILLLWFPLLLQSVVLYSLPELDGAIDTVPLGGLVGDDIYLVPERVTRLASRLHK